MDIQAFVKAKLDNGEWEFPVSFFSVEANGGFDAIPQGDTIVDGVHYRVSMCSLEVFKIFHLFHGQRR